MFEKEVMLSRGKYLYGLKRLRLSVRMVMSLVFFRELVRYSILLIRETDFINGNQLRFSLLLVIWRLKTKKSNFLQLSDWIAIQTPKGQLILKDILAQVAEGRNISWF